MWAETLLHPRRSLWRSAALYRVAASLLGDTEERYRLPLWSNHDETFPLSSAPASGCVLCVGENSAAAPCQHVLVRPFLCLPAYRIFHDVLPLTVFFNSFIGGVCLVDLFSCRSEQKPRHPESTSGSCLTRCPCVPPCVLRGRECINIPPSPPTVLCTSWAVCWCAARRSSSQRSLLQGQQLCCQDVFKSSFCSAFYQCELDQLSSALG